MTFSLPKSGVLIAGLLLPQLLSTAAFAQQDPDLKKVEEAIAPTAATSTQAEAETEEYREYVAELVKRNQAFQKDFQTMHRRIERAA